MTMSMNNFYNTNTRSCVNQTIILHFNKRLYFQQYEYVFKYSTYCRYHNHRTESIFSTNIGQISSLIAQYFISLLKLAQRHPGFNSQSSAQLSTFDGASRYISVCPSRRNPTMFVAFNGRNSSKEVPGPHVIIRTDDPTRPVCICKKLHWHTMTSSNETFSVLLAFVRGIHRWPVHSPHKVQWLGAFIFSLIYAWTNVWANNRDAGDLRRHRTHYDVTVMTLRQTQ